ncbi:GDSL-type esterase/lipase family protein [Marinicellulosiphila megalodicopiae]|uniref:GDSL-type esterase/lipase family protein n=1 Tax=Marinicellulosiphila megalodicopiae TaxID=2724896 RepID=UPI003BB0AFF4
MTEPFNIQVPAPRTVEYDWMSIQTWHNLNNQQLQTAKNQADINYIFAGDSITQAWPESIWQTHFAPLKSLNLGIGGDQTQNLLWRLQQPEILALTPKFFVLLIGTNNLGHANHNALQTANGINIVVEYILNNFNDCHIFLHNIFPADASPHSQKRQQIIEANQQLKQSVNENSRITYLEFFDIFLNNKQEIESEIMEDYLHLTQKGYQLWCNNLLKYIKQ